VTVRRFRPGEAGQRILSPNGQVFDSSSTATRPHLEMADTVTFPQWIDRTQKAGEGGKHGRARLPALRQEDEEKAIENAGGGPRPHVRAVAAATTTSRPAHVDSHPRLQQRLRNELPVHMTVAPVRCGCDAFDAEGRGGAVSR